MAIHPLRDLGLAHHHALTRRDRRLKKRQTFFMAARGILDEANRKDKFNHVGPLNRQRPQNADLQTPESVSNTFFVVSFLQRQTDVAPPEALFTTVPEQRLPIRNPIIEPQNSLPKTFQRHFDGTKPRDVTVPLHFCTLA